MTLPVAVTESSARCPLCAHDSAWRLERISYETIWSELKLRYAAKFSSEVIARNTPPSGFTTLSECKRCGLQYFVPVLAGDAEFYEGLSTPNLEFADDRWEFRAARGIITDTDAVVDFGCGEGAFLRSLRLSQRRRVGVDHSREALRKLEAGGVEGYACDFAEFAGRERGRFDVACAFHVAEHLPDLGLLVSAAISCLRAGGTLLIAVPNRERLYTRGFPVLDCPPHHISRWQSEQFVELANRFGLQLLGVHFERRRLPPLQKVIRHGAPLALQTAKHLVSRTGSRVDFHGGHVAAAEAANRARPSLIRRLAWGHSMLAEFKTADRPL